MEFNPIPSQNAQLFSATGAKPVLGINFRERYSVYDRLGSGGSATVYLARDTKTGQMVVIKVMHSYLLDDLFIERFKREVTILRQLDSPHIIKLYDWGLDEFEPALNDNISYLIGEFVEGHTLAGLIQTQGKFSEHDALSIIRQTAIGLSEIHKSGVIHRDIKSQNIMITPDRTTKIIDFGIAKSAQSDTITNPSQFAGTLHYAAPEQILDTADVDNRTDIYALGVVFYEMLSARLPIKEREFGASASRIVAGDIDPLPEASAEVDTLVRSMMARRPEERPGSAKSLVASIDEILGHDNSPVVPDLPDTFMMKRLFSKNNPTGNTQHATTYVLLTDDGKRIPLSADSMVVGRSHPNDPTIPDIDLFALGVENARTASRQHCRIFQDGTTYFIEDLESMNGTKINDAPLPAGRRHPLSSGDRIRAGHVSLQFKKE